MKINSDYKDLLRNLNAAGVRYLIDRVEKSNRPSA
jgi:hypothetical protein